MTARGSVDVAGSSAHVGVVPSGRTSAALVRPGWPLTALLVPFPLWWVLGMGALIPFVLAVPMAVHLLRKRPVVVPAGFGLWLLFLVWVVASTVMLGYNPPGTLPAPASSRLISVAYNFAGYLTATVVLLYAVNLTEEEFPRRRLVRQLGWFFGVVVGGGLLGILAPRFEFVSPVEMLLPDRVARDVFVQSLVHPSAAQVQDVLGFASARPSAPFGFTNMWGYVFTLLVAWFVVSSLSGSRLRKLAAVVVLAVSAVPVVYSLNRGLWLGLAIVVAFTLFRLVMRGNVAAVGTVMLGVVVAAVLVVSTPLTGLVENRLENGHSNDIRTFTTERTLDAVSYSPVLGLGSTRAALGSANSIAAGQSKDCPRCGNPTLGSNGQIWAVLIGHGFGGAAFLVGFLLRSLWAYRRDRTPIGDAGLAAVLLNLYFMFIYNSLTMPQIFVFLSIALLHKNKLAQEAEALQRDPSVPAMTTPAGRALVGRPGPVA